MTSPLICEAVRLLGHLSPLDEQIPRPIGAYPVASLFDAVSK
jgi:hypothetical protein